MGVRVNHVCEDCFFLRDCKDDTYLFSGGRFDKGYCTELKTFYYPNDKICVHFQNKETYTPGGCYITTMVCDMLGYDDKCHIL